MNVRRVRLLPLGGWDRVVGRLGQELVEVGQLALRECFAPVAEHDSRRLAPPPLKQLWLAPLALNGNPPCTISSLMARSVIIESNAW